MRGLFVTATDTGVGKTIVCASLLAAIAADGQQVSAYKPVVTGLTDEHEIDARGPWPADHELLASVAAMQPEDVSPLRYGVAASPLLAGELAGVSPDPGLMLDHARALAEARGPDSWLIVEGVGGLLVPLADGYSVRELAGDLGLALVIVARPGLGTINHTLLTLNAAREAGLSVRAVVLTPWPQRPSAVELSNRHTIAEVGAVEVQTLAAIPGPDPAALAAAGQSLPWRRWLTATAQAAPAASTIAAATTASSSPSITYGGIA